MMVNTDLLVPMTDANQNFSRVVRMVDENGMAVILRNNKPQYVVVGFAEYDELELARKARREKISAVADSLITENMEAFRELAK